MRISLLVLFLVGVSGLRAQAPRESFVKLKFGDPIFGSDVRINDNAFGIKSVTINDTTYDESVVMYFRSAQGRLFGSVNGRLRPSVHEDKMLIFMINGNYNSVQPYGGVGFGLGLSISQSRNRYFYNKKLEPVKRLTINNLLPDVNDDPQAFEYIVQAKNFRTASLAGYGVALGSVVYIFATPTISSSSSGLSTTGRTQYMVAGGAFLAGILTGAICNLIKWEKIRLGVKQYSGYYLYR